MDKKQVSEKRKVPLTTALPFAELEQRELYTTLERLKALEESLQRVAGRQSRMHARLAEHFLGNR